MIVRVLKELLQRKVRQRRNLFIGAAPTTLVPNGRINGKQVERLLAHKYLALKGETVFRNSIRYLHYPVDCHQENVETDTPLYASLARATASMLTVDTGELRRLSQQRLAKDLPTLLPGCSFGIVRLRDILFPLTTKLLYELLFERECSEGKTRILSGSAQNVLKSSKGLALPDTATRRLALEYIREELKSHPRGQRFFEGSGLPPEISAKHILGVAFHTGSIQIVEFTSHVLLELAKQSQLVQKIRNEPDSVQLDTVLIESLRMFPITGMTNRVAMQDILLENGMRIRSGHQVLFDFKSHQVFGYEDPNVFRPDRWLNIKKADACYMPFGTGSRKCPAERFAHLLTAELVKGIVDRFDILAPGEHVRSLEGGGLCCLVHRSADESDKGVLPVISAYLRMRDALDQLRFDVLKLIIFPRIIEAAQKHAQNSTQLC